jgi:hypothetical protein
MNKFYLKYKSMMVSLILSGYFFLFGYNISHYHKYDINFSPESYFEEENDTRVANKHLSYLGFECLIHNTYSSVHNTLLSAQEFSSSSITEIELLKFYPQQFYFSNQFYPSNLLRAPPAFS